MLTSLEQFENDIRAGVSRSIAFHQFDELETDQNENIYLMLATNGNDLDVTQYILQLGGKAHITGPKLVSCCVSPDIIRRIAELDDVVLVELLSGPVRRIK